MWLRARGIDPDVAYRAHRESLNAAKVKANELERLGQKIAVLSRAQTEDLSAASDALERLPKATATRKRKNASADSSAAPPEAAPAKAKATCKRKTASADSSAARPEAGPAERSEAPAAPAASAAAAAAAPAECLVCEHDPTAATAAPATRSAGTQTCSALADPAAPAGPAAAAASVGAAPATPSAGASPAARAKYQAGVLQCLRQTYANKKLEPEECSVWLTNFRQNALDKALDPEVTRAGVAWFCDHFGVTEDGKPAAPRKSLLRPPGQRPMAAQAPRRSITWATTLSRGTAVASTKGTKDLYIQRPGSTTECDFCEQRVPTQSGRMVSGQTQIKRGRFVCNDCRDELWDDYLKAKAMNIESWPESPERCGWAVLAILLYVRDLRENMPAVIMHTIPAISFDTYIYIYIYIYVCRKLLRS